MEGIETLIGQVKGARMDGDSGEKRLLSKSIRD
jgi:hypothetical protein